MGYGRAACSVSSITIGAPTTTTNGGGSYPPQQGPPQVPGFLEPVANIGKKVVNWFRNPKNKERARKAKEVVETGVETYKTAKAAYDKYTEIPLSEDPNDYRNINGKWVNWTNPDEFPDLHWYTNLKMRVPSVMFKLSTRHDIRKGIITKEQAKKVASDRIKGIHTNDYPFTPAKYRSSVSRTGSYVDGKYQLSNGWNLTQRDLVGLAVVGIIVFVFVIRK